ncbi:MAG: hypothetical protein ACKO6N_19960 [Myxococcota bacterium]
MQTSSAASEVEPARVPSWGIWGLAFGYFACYVPYSALVKAVTQGALPGIPEKLSSAETLPLMYVASVVCMYGVLTGLGWWRYAPQLELGGWRLPYPSWALLPAGLCTAAITVTTTLAYTFTGVSIVFVMLLMRGGVLVLAPLVDLLTGRKVRWFSLMGLGLSLMALLVAFSDDHHTGLTWVVLLDVGLYLLAYFVRLRLMTRLAKSSEADANRRYFVEEQLLATPLVVLALGLLAFWGEGAFMQALRRGFMESWGHPALWAVLLMGVLSQGTGIFGGLVLLDPRENTFCVPVNRSSSVLAGVVAAWVLSVWMGQPPPGAEELLGAAFILGAILFLTLPPLWEKRQARRRSS